MISVIVTIYNVEKYLPKCIESILNQTYKNLEIVLINDGSTDSSKDICNKYANIDHRIQIINQNNIGVSAARNNGLKRATGKYIYFMDGDDYIHPQMLEILESCLESNIYDFAMVSGIITYNINSKFNDIPISFEKKILTQSDLFKGLFNFAEEKEIQYQVVWNKLYRKDIIKNLSFKRTGSEDTEFNSRVFLQCHNAIYLKLQLYHWVQRSTSITHQPINDNYIDRMYSYYITLNNIPFEMIENRSFCLEKLYKTMLNIRYHTKNTFYKSSVQQYIQELKKQTYSEFWHNNCIKLHRKIGLSIFLHVPLIYTIFMKIMDLKAKL